MTTYRVPVADPVLAHNDFWLDVEGLRFVSVEGPWFRDPNIIICTFEDDNAPAELEGKLIEPVIMRHPDGRLTVLDRNVVTA